MIINQQIIIATIPRNLSIVERTIKFSPRGRQILFVTFAGGGATKHFNVKIKDSDFCHNIIPILKAKPISLL